MSRQDGWFGTFAAKLGVNNLGSAAASAMNEAVFGSYSSGEGLFCVWDMLVALPLQ
jgi:lipid-binding SYLF domain-containing protein